MTYEFLKRLVNKYKSLLLNINFTLKITNLTKNLISNFKIKKRIIT